MNKPIEKQANEKQAISIQKDTKTQYTPLVFLTISPLCGNSNGSFSWSFLRYTNVNTPRATKMSENKMESRGYKGDGEPSTKEWNLPITNITMMATKLTPANANKTMASFFKDLILFSPTFLNEACNNNIAQIDMKHDKKSGNDLVASLNAESIEPQTIEPMQSAKAYIALRNVYAEKT